MSRIHAGVISLWLTAGLAGVHAQQYGISTYAGGAPAAPTAAISMAIDPSGNLYFADGYGYTSGPARSNSVFKIDPSGFISRFAGNSRTGFSGDGAQATGASLTAPRAVASDSAGNVFIVDAGNQRVRRVSPDGIITTVAGGGSAVLGDGGPATKGQLNYPQSIAIDSRGNLFVGEFGRVRKVSPDGTITTVAGGGPDNPDGSGPATSARLSTVVRVAVDGAGNLFLADQGYDEATDEYGYNLRKVSPDGLISTLPPIPFCCYGDMTADAAGNLFVTAGPNVWKLLPNGARTIVAGNGSYGASAGDGQLAIRAQLSGPTAVTVNAAGDLFIADNAGRSVRKVTPDGIIRAFASIPGLPPAVSGDGGPAIAVQLQLAFSGLATQSGLAVDVAGNLYIAETAAHRVRKVSPSGTITTVAGTGAQRCFSPSECLPLGDGGPAIRAALSFPTSVAVDSAGNLFIADSSNLRVRKVSPDGIITTVAGNGIAPPWVGAVSNGGPATGARLGFVSGLAVDSAGNLFISDLFAQRVRKIDLNGIITTVGGNGIPGYSGDGGPAASATLDYPLALAADGAGNVYVSDFNQSVRQLRPVAQ